MPHISKWDVALDVGAHVGIWSTRLAERFKRVIAFEPVPKHIECWKQNMSKFISEHNEWGNISTLETVALGHENGTAVMKVPNTTNSGNNSYTYNWTLSNPNTSVNSNDESPEFSLSDIGTWDLNLSILSNSNCTFNYEEFDVLSLVGEPSFTTDFDGVLCNSESITLVTN